VLAIKISLWSRFLTSVRFELDGWYLQNGVTLAQPLVLFQLRTGSGERIFSALEAYLERPRWTFSTSLTGYLLAYLLGRNWLVKLDPRDKVDLPDYSWRSFVAAYFPPQQVGPSSLDGMGPYECEDLRGDGEAGVLEGVLELPAVLQQLGDEEEGAEADDEDEVSAAPVAGCHLRTDL
jgi:hypothetical protein